MFFWPESFSLFSCVNVLSDSFFAYVVLLRRLAIRAFVEAAQRFVQMVRPFLQVIGCYRWLIVIAGSLSGGQGARFFLANTEQLYTKLGEMRERIRSLEGALGMMQAARSNSPHPLLQQDLLSIKSIQNLQPSTDQDASDVLDDFGTLRITSHGAMQFLGRTSGTEVSPLVHMWAESNSD